VGEKRTTAALLGSMTVALLVGRARWDRAAVLSGILLRWVAELLSGREEDDGCAAWWYDGCAAGWES
jgi:hypothetical protein